MDNLMVIAAGIAKRRCEGEPDFEQRILKAMRGAREFDSMLTDDGKLMLAAIAAVLTCSDGADRRQLERFADTNKAVGAMMSGLPVAMDAILARYEDLPPWPVRPIFELWEASKHG